MAVEETKNDGQRTDGMLRGATIVMMLWYVVVIASVCSPSLAFGTLGVALGAYGWGKEAARRTN